jgi:N-acetyltransferase 10
VSRGKLSRTWRSAITGSSQLINESSLFPLQKELQLPVSQNLALFAKIIRKISKRLINIQKAAISKELPKPNTAEMSSVRPDDSLSKEPGAVVEAIEEELNEAGSEAMKALKERQKEFLNSLDFKK